MNCCSNCFNDKEIKGFILSNSNDKGNCDFCGDINVPVIDCKELDETFQPVLSVFEIQAAPGIGSNLLHEKIQEMWGVFNIAPPAAQALLKAICESTLANGAELLNKPVQVSVLANQQARPMCTVRNGKTLRTKSNLKTDSF